MRYFRITIYVPSKLTGEWVHFAYQIRSEDSYRDFMALLKSGICCRLEVELYSEE